MIKNMKKISVLLAVLSLAMFSCSKNKLPNPALAKIDKGQLSNLPSWVLSPEVEGGVAAVGIASKSRGGFKFQISKAEMDAKANIATTIQSEISRVTKEALREAKVNDTDDVEEVFSQATKEVVRNMPLSGATRINIHQGTDGTLYVHMILKNKDYSSYIKSSQKVFEDRLKAAKLGRESINRSQEAVKGLFDELEKERGQ
jgi:hypothetical protein